jgi:lathosterol oxidase
MDTLSAKPRKVFNIYRLAPSIDWGIIVFLFLTGLLHPSPHMFYSSLAILFVCLTGSVLLISFLLYTFSDKNGVRIQGERKKTPPIGREIFDTTRAMFVGACLAAWPLGLYRAGLPTGYAWTLIEMGLTWWMVVLEMYVGIIVIDAYSYWKHRLLHTRLLFPFHKNHHSFRDPTPFAGFAVGPLEALLTFWPVLIICYPPAKHFVPLYMTAIVAFVLLNLYLHSGVSFFWIEKIIPPIGLNSSVWHNVHHSDVVSNFGELSYIWDKICKTSRQDMARKKLQQADLSTETDMMINKGIEQA